MTKVTFEEIAQLRTELAAYEDALKALDVIEDCEGDLEDAALVLAIEIGQQPDGPEWLDGFTKRCRVAICDQSLRENLLNGKYAIVIEFLRQKGICPVILAVPVLMYILKQGIEEFCEPLELKL
ncbi:MAG TPA: hypothetical protein V6D13_03865 [Halomicronema sp.]